MKKCLLLLLVVTACRPCLPPDPQTPTSFFMEECMDTCMGDLPVANLACWWEQFDDSLLISLIERGLTYNYDLQIARERICQARGIMGVDAAVLFPHIDGDVMFNRDRNSQTLSQTPFTGGDFVNIYAAGFDSIWELDLFGKNLDKTRAACFDIAAAAAEVRDVHVTVASEIAVNYFIIRTLQKRIEITQSHIDSETELYELVQARHDAGLISQLDVSLAKALLDGRKAMLPKLEASYYQTIYALAVMLGDLPEQLVDCFCDHKPLPCVAAQFPLGFPSELLCRRGDVRQAEFEMRAAGARVMAARKEFFPTISIQSLFHYATGFFTSWIKPESRHWMIEPGLSLPIFHGGEILANVEVQTSIQHQSVLNYELTVLQAVEEVESALVGYFQQGARIGHLEDEIAALKEASELSRILYFGGVEDFLYVIETERNLYSTEIVLQENIADWMTEMVAVYKALGGGWECCD